MNWSFLRSFSQYLITIQNIRMHIFPYFLKVPLIVFESEGNGEAKVDIFRTLEGMIDDQNYLIP